MESIEVEAKTVEEAVQKALNLLKVSREEVTIKVVREEKKGLFGMCGAVLVKVKVSKK